MTEDLNLIENSEKYKEFILQIFKSFNYERETSVAFLLSMVEYTLEEIVPVIGLDRTMVVYDTFIEKINAFKDALDIVN